MVALADGVLLLGPGSGRSVVVLIRGVVLAIIGGVDLSPGLGEAKSLTKARIGTGDAAGGCLLAGCCWLLAGCLLAAGCLMAAFWLAAGCFFACFGEDGRFWCSRSLSMASCA